MRLTNRCWRAVAHRLGESTEPADALVWAKVKQEAKGKGLTVTPIALTAGEELIIMQVLNDPGDGYVAFVVSHECQVNPDLPVCPDD